MHLSIHTWMRSEPLVLTVARAARFGYQSIEIAGEPERYKVADIDRLLKESGLSCWGAVTMMEDGRSLIDPDESVRTSSIDYTRAVVTMASELGAEEVTIVPAEIGRTDPAADPEDEWGWAVDALREIYGHAYQRGVRLALEPINRYETYFLTRLEQALALADAVGPECGVCLDTFHMNIEEPEPLEAIARAGDRLVDVHVADTNQLACGMGHWDWPEVVAGLEAIGYAGALAVEFFAYLDRTPANPFPQALNRDPAVDSEISEDLYSHLVAECASTLKPLLAHHG